MVEQQSSKLPARVRFLLSLLLFFNPLVLSLNAPHSHFLQTKFNKFTFQTPKRHFSGLTIRYRGPHNSPVVPGKDLKWSLISRTRPVTPSHPVRSGSNFNFLSSLVLLNTGLTSQFELNPFLAFFLSSRSLTSNVVRISPDLASLVTGSSFVPSFHTTFNRGVDFLPTNVNSPSREPLESEFKFLTQSPYTNSSGLAQGRGLALSVLSYFKLEHLRLNHLSSISFRSIESQRSAIFSLQQFSWKRRTGRNVPRFYALTKDRFDRPFYGARFKPGIGFVTSFNSDSLSTYSAFDFYNSLLKQGPSLALGSTVALYPRRFFTATRRVYDPKTPYESDTSLEQSLSFSQRVVSWAQPTDRTRRRHAFSRFFQIGGPRSELTEGRLESLNSASATHLKSQRSTLMRRRFVSLNRVRSLRGGMTSKVLGLNLLKTPKSLLISDKFGSVLANRNPQERSRLLRRLKARFGRSGRMAPKSGYSHLYSASRLWLDVSLDSSEFKYRAYRYGLPRDSSPSRFEDATLSDLTSQSGPSKVSLNSPAASFRRGGVSGTSGRLLRFFTQWRFLAPRLLPSSVVSAGLFRTQPSSSARLLSCSPLRRQFFWRLLRNSLKSRRRVKSRSPLLFTQSQSITHLARPERLGLSLGADLDSSDTLLDSIRSSIPKHKQFSLPESSYSPSSGQALLDLQRRLTSIRSLGWAKLRLRDRMGRLVSVLTPTNLSGRSSVVQNITASLPIAEPSRAGLSASGGLAGLVSLMDVFIFAKSYRNPLLFKYLSLRQSTGSFSTGMFAAPGASSVSSLVYSTHQLASFTSSDRNLSKTISCLDTPMVLKLAVRRRIAYTLGSDIRSSNINYFYGRFLSEFIEHTTGRHSFVKLNPAIESGLTFADKAKLASWEPRIVGFKRIMGPKIFIVEALHLVCLSLRLKDPTFLANWIRAMMNRLSFWKQRLVFRYLKYLLRYLFEPYFAELGIRGVKFQLKGKISVAGNARTRTLFYKIGNTSQSQMDSKVAYDLSFVETFTGILGFKLWFFF